MKAMFSEKFLTRISEYPVPVQEKLSETLDASMVREATRVLHGKSLNDEEKIAEVLERFKIVDTFLGHLISAKRFIGKRSEILKDIQSSDQDRVQETVTDFVAPLSDLSLPYIYKLREVAATENQGDLPDFLLVLDFYRRLREYSNDTEHALAQFILSGDMPFMSPLGRAYGARGVAQLGAPRPASISAKEAEAIARGFLKTLLLAPLSETAAFDLVNCAQRFNADLEDLQPRPVGGPFNVLLPPDADESCVSWWESQRVNGLVDEVAQEDTAPAHWTKYLSISSGIYPSQIALAYLTRQDAKDGTVQICVNAEKLSWEDQIIGYPEQDASLTCIGTFETGGTATESSEAKLVWKVARSNSVSAAHAKVTIDNCYAIIVKLDDICDPAAFTNYEFCIVVNGFKDLAKQFSKTKSQSALCKPVVFLSKHTPLWREYLISTAESHWRYAGLTPTAPVFGAMNQKDGSLHLKKDGEEGLGHVAPSGLTGMPLSRALDIATTKPDIAAMMTRGLFVDTESVIVRHETWYDGMILEHGAKLDRWMSSIDLLLEERDLVFLWSHVDFLDLNKRLPSVGFWPIAGRILSRTQDIANRAVRMSRAQDGMSVRQATAILLQVSRGDRHEIESVDFERFALALSRQPHILLGLEAKNVVTYLDLVVQSRIIDQIAINLSIFATDICQLDKGVVLPLFGVLANGLPHDQLQIVIATCSAEVFGSHRQIYRLAEVHRRYGTAQSMLNFFYRQSQRNSDLVEKPDFRKMFTAMVEVFDDEQLSPWIDQRNIAGIRETISFESAFQNAVRTGNKERMIQLISQPEKIKNVDLIKWADGLRAYSNELRKAQIPIDQIQHPDMTNLHKCEVLGTTFFDLDVLKGLRDCNMLGKTSDLNLVARQIIGDNDAVNEFIAQKSSSVSFPPLVIKGDGIEAVFANAAKATDQVKRAGSRTTDALVSVIMSAFNPDIALLKQAVDSILNQTHSNVELFVIDDKSEDESSAAIAALLDGYDDRVRLLRMPENCGPYVGRNRAIAESSGDFIAIQDADDWCHPDRFAEQLKAFAENPLYQIVTAPHIRIDWGGFVQMEARFSVLGDGPMTSMFRRSVFDKVGHFAAVRSRGDIEMRERARSYFGPHSLHELDVPIMLCLADSQTLSQKTKGEKAEFLQIFRTNISKRRELRQLRNRGQALVAAQIIQVPVSLRPPLTMIEAFCPKIQTESVSDAKE